MLISKIKFFSLITIFCFIVTACDQFSRFRQEKYDCGNNSTGFKEIIFNKLKSGSVVKITRHGKEFETNILEIKNNQILLNFKDTELQVFTDKETVLVKNDNKITVLNCSKTIFKM